jgi:hypothetical protein
MKFPPNIHNEVESIFRDWKQAAINIGIEYGIYVNARRIYVYTPNQLEESYYRLCFVFNDLEFECLKDLRKAIETFKAFM